jgi:hypothetical protein
MLAAGYTNDSHENEKRETLFIIILPLSHLSSVKNQKASHSKNQLLSSIFCTMANKEIDLYKIAQQDYNVLEEMITSNPEIMRTKDSVSLGVRTLDRAWVTKFVTKFVA